MICGSGWPRLVSRKPPPPPGSAFPSRLSKSCASANGRVGGGAAPPPRSRPAARRGGSRGVGGLPAPAARCHPGRVARVGGRARRPGRARGHDGAGQAGAGLAAKKKSVHAAGRATDRVRALRAERDAGGGPDPEWVASGPRPGAEPSTGRCDGHRRFGGWSGRWENC